MRSPDLDLRILRYVIAVAEAGSFTRAAAVLHVSQPALSQAVQGLERDLGTRLIERGPRGAARGIRLTAAGEVFLPAARELLVQAERAVLAAREAGAGVQLRVGFGTSTPRSLVRAVLDAAASIGQEDPVLEHVPWGSELAALLAGRVDLVFLQGPAGLTRPDVDLVALGAAPRMAVFRAGHPLAARPAVAMSDLAREPIIDAGSDREYWLVDPRPDGTRPVIVGPPARTVEEMLAFVSAGRGMAITSASVAETSGSEELAFVPIGDLDAATVHLATRSSDHRAEPAALRERLTRGA